MAIISDTLTTYPSGYDSTDYSYASVNSSYPLSNAVGKDSAQTSTYSRWNIKTGSSAESWLYYLFDCSSIPEGATIDSVSCSARCSISSTNTSRINTKTIQLYSGSTAKGSATSITSTSSTSYTMKCGTWTREELQNCRIKFYAKRGTSWTTTTYYFRFYGATLTISYTYNNISYIISTSCNTGGTIRPNGDTDVSQGDNFSLKIIPDENYKISSVTLDGSNVTSSIVEKEMSPASYNVATASGASYGFNLNSNNYYESTNQGISESASVCRVTFNLPVSATVNFYVINYAESTYDYGILGNVNIALDTTYSADSNYKWSGSGNQSSSEQIISYTLDAGESFVDIKYRKDSYVDNNNDSLQFRIEIILSEEVIATKYYEYELLNVQQAHTIAVVFSKEESTTTLYMKVNGTWTEVSFVTIYKKIDGTWVEQSDVAGVFDTEIKYIKG